ncbi:uncharacterized protein F13E9.13, mitochondrial [Polyodon spathula]|uniref:uncharacterized protein F13E9.13, mitochondrial n=1 Tax=Polyodon spathula TaxID=7913 RepID=UPI001B7F238B|nr:uncharacterized protein F13E9.13, mitochondrial [Polyodon spathula]
MTLVCAAVRETYPIIPPIGVQILSAANRFHAVTADVRVAETAKAAEFFLSDEIIVTRTATGMQTDPEEFREVVQAVRNLTLIGSGVICENVEHYLGASGKTIGSYFKKGGFWSRGQEFNGKKNT